MICALWSFSRSNLGVRLDFCSRFASQGIKKSDAARKQRDLKKFGKQIQVEKLKQREMDKKSFAERMHGIKRSASQGFARSSLYSKTG